MSTKSPRLSLRSPLLAAAIGIGGPHAPALAAPDLPIVTETCPVLGRDPSHANAVRLGCGVWSPDDFAATPGWGVLELMALDPFSWGGGVVATLWCTSRASGARSVAAVVRSANATKATKFSARLAAPMDFSRCAYHVTVDTLSGPDGQPGGKALMVVLRK
jgi:hypothetical protein